MNDFSWNGPVPFHVLRREQGGHVFAMLNASPLDIHH